jgi:hypothetical protein
MFTLLAKDPDVRIVGGAAVAVGWISMLLLRLGLTLLKKPIDRLSEYFTSEADLSKEREYYADVYIIIIIIICKAFMNTKSLKYAGVINQGR